MDSLIATARSNKVATVLAMQDFSQLRKDYGREQADVIVNICGNVISGQVMGDTAKTLSERFAKIMQGRESRTINRTDTSVSYSQQLEHAVPSAKISALSSGEFVGMSADDPSQKIKLKMFHAEVINDSEKINQEMSLFEDIPVVNELTQEQVLDNYYQIKMDIRELIEKEVQRLIAEKKRRPDRTASEAFLVKKSEDKLRKKKSYFCDMGRKISNKTELLTRLGANADTIRSFGIDRVSVFGSFARNTKIHSSSDVDLVLDFLPGKKSFDNLVDLGDFLEDLLGRKVELLTRESLKSKTGKHILSTAQEIAI